MLGSGYHLSDLSEMTIANMSVSVYCIVRNLDEILPTGNVLVYYIARCHHSTQYGEIELGRSLESEDGARCCHEEQVGCRTRSLSVVTRWASQKQM